MDARMHPKSMKNATLSGTGPRDGQNATRAEAAPRVELESNPFGIRNLTGGEGVDPPVRSTSLATKSF